LLQSLNLGDVLDVRLTLDLQKLAEKLLHELNGDQYITGPVCPLPDKQYAYPKSFQLYFCRYEKHIHFLKNVDISTVTQRISFDFRFVSSLFSESGFAEATAIWYDSPKA